MSALRTLMYEGQALDINMLDHQGKLRSYENVKQELEQSLTDGVALSFRRGSSSGPHVLPSAFAALLQDASQVIVVTPKATAAPSSIYSSSLQGDERSPAPHSDLGATSSRSSALRGFEKAAAPPQPWTPAPHCHPSAEQLESDAMDEQTESSDAHIHSALLDDIAQQPLFGYGNKFYPQSPISEPYSPPLTPSPREQCFKSFPPIIPPLSCTGYDTPPTSRPTSVVAGGPVIIGAETVAHHYAEPTTMVRRKAPSAFFGRAGGFFESDAISEKRAEECSQSLKRRGSITFSSAPLSPPPRYSSVASDDDDEPVAHDWCGGSETGSEESLQSPVEVSFGGQLTGLKSSKEGGLSVRMLEKALKSSLVLAEKEEARSSGSARRSQTAEKLHSVYSRSISPPRPPPPHFGSVPSFGERPGTPVRAKLSLPPVTRSPPHLDRFGYGLRPLQGRSVSAPTSSSPYLSRN